MSTQENKALIRRVWEEVWNKGDFAAEQEVIAEGDKVVDRWTMRATHTGPFMNMPPTGKQVTFTGMDIARVENGKIVEYWHQQDGLGLLQQLGVIPSMG